MRHDSTADTLAHIARVRDLLERPCNDLAIRAAHHDESKLVEPEKSGYDALGELIQGKTYGTPGYSAVMQDPRVKPAIDHHVTTNRHHPQYHADGVNDMTLLDLLEMLADWKAASERSTGVALSESLALTCQRWDISPQLEAILRNTCEAFGW